jgi:GT2 family glycosyltransferase
MPAALRCTAIVPTLDRAVELEACLRSLRDTRPSFEAVIVADQGDSQALRSLVEAFGARYLHLDRRGLSRARNAALALATTPWLYFPDDDCTAAADLLERVAAALERRPQAGFVAARVLTPDGRPVMAGMDGGERVLATPEDVLATVMSPGLFVAARVLERCGGFDERFGVGAEWPSGEESDLLFRAFAAGESGVYAAEAVVTHPDPYAGRDKAAWRRRARLYGRGWGALFAKHAATPTGAAFAALQRHYETRALGGAVLSAAGLRLDRARRHWESWRGRREGWLGWRAAAERAAPADSNRERARP